MGHDQYVAVVRLALRLAYDVFVPVLPDVSDQTIQALRDVFWAPASLGGRLSATTTVVLKCLHFTIIHPV